MSRLLDGIFVTLVICACHGTPPASSDPMATVMPALYMLGSLPLDTGAAAEATRLRAERGQQRFEQGVAAFEAQRYDEAAGHFMAAAADFWPGPDGFAAAILRDNRASCYRNAALAFRAAGGQSGRDQLVEAASRDPDHAALLQRLVDEL